MAYDSAATRARLLDAAYAEFAERGLAGARVDRIATVAGANKQAIYAYFGSKDGLFDATLAQRLQRLADAAPITPDDLPGYAGALFDALGERPELLRLTQWQALERAQPTPGEVDSHLSKAHSLRTELGLSSEAIAVDVLEIVIAMSTAWLRMPPTLQAVGGLDLEQRRLEHRALLVASVRAMIDALSLAATPPPRPR